MDPLPQACGAFVCDVGAVDLRITEEESLIGRKAVDSVVFRLRLQRFVQREIGNAKAAVSATFSPSVSLPLSFTSPMAM